MNEPWRRPRVVVLAGGVGGARMAQGFAACDNLELAIVVNVGDDDDFHGLRVCPDLDTVLYTLAGVVNSAQGWGVAGDSQKGLGVLRKLNAADVWMQLGDADLGLHIYRTQRLRQSERLTEITKHLACSFGLTARLLPASDEDCPTLVETDEGTMRFQEWFVKARSSPRFRLLDLSAAHAAMVTDEVRQVLIAADLIVVAPSNPFLSIEPMLALGGMRELLRDARAWRVAVSPLIGGRAVKGPLTKVMRDLGLEVTQETIMHRYLELIDAFVLDESDRGLLPDLEQKGQTQTVEVLALPTLIVETLDAQRLAQELLALASARAEANSE